MEKPYCKAELDECESEMIQKTKKKKSVTEGWIKLLQFFFPLVLIIYNVCFLSTICFSLHLDSAQGSPDLGEFLAATATQILKYAIRGGCSIINFQKQN